MLKYERRKTMASKTNNFQDLLIAKIDEYTDKAFEHDKAEERQKYKEVVKLLQELFVKINSLHLD